MAQQFPKKKGRTQFPDKYETKYDPTPPVGSYDVDAGIEATRPRSPALAVMREPLNLYKKPESIRPEVNDGYMEPFGGGVKGGAGMSGKYKNS